MLILSNLEMTDIVLIYKAKCKAWSAGCIQTYSVVATGNYGLYGYYSIEADGLSQS